MREEKCTIVKNRKLGGDYYLMKLEADYVARQAGPGNFIMLAASFTTDPLLKRPFGILNAVPPHIWIYYQVVGKGTRLISRLKENDKAHLIGPLGNTFPELRGENILLLAGGRGIAPLYYAARDYTGDNAVFLIYGAGSKDDLNLIEEIDSLPLKEIFLYTDDGSTGKRGLITADIKEIIETHDINVTISCGPEAMFRALHKEIGSGNTDNYVSMEALMGCGFGICHSCVAQAADDSYKKVCQDGPVFKMEEMAWPT
jgi:dihydroorotate dehydrogenase electron transfer subunit